jgi:hypothetical protein
MSKRISQISDVMTENLESALQELNRSKSAWGEKSISDRLEILNEIKNDFLSICDDWAKDQFEK